MHVVVCVKMVPDTTQVKIDPVTNTMVREGVPFITNPFDDHAVEEALCVKDRYGAKVTIVSMGPLPAESVIKRAMARGADAGVLLSDRAFGGSDTLATSRIIAASVRRLSDEQPVDLVICGRQTIDGDTAQVGPGVATRLGYSQVTLVDAVIGVDAAKGTLVVRAKMDDRYEVIEARLPALITVVREINRPRYPSVEGRLVAEEAIIPVWNNEVLKLDRDSIGLKGSPTWVKRIFAPERKKAEIVQGLGDRLEEAIERIVEKLDTWKIPLDGAPPE
ncbi:MAG: electron transfer flavoprotein subunit beta/FixA family protein [Syntrophorhabdales bacterium]